MEPQSSQDAQKPQGILEQRAVRLYETLARAQGGIAVGRRLVKETGPEFGKALFEIRSKAEACAGGTTFNATLDRLQIPHSTAYRWLKKYELSVGIRQAKPVDPVDPEVAEVFEYGPAGLDPTPENRKWARRMMLATQMMSRTMAKHAVPLGCGNPTKIRAYAQGCHREELTEMVERLRGVRRMLAGTLPILEAMLKVEESRRAKRLARVRDQQAGASTPEIAITTSAVVN